MLAAHIADENPLRTWAFEALEEEAMQISDRDGEAEARTPKVEGSQQQRS